jgi:hypothetical protein
LYLLFALNSIRDYYLISIDTTPQPTGVWIGAGISTLILLAALSAGIFVTFWKKRRAKPENQMTVMTSKNVISATQLIYKYVIKIFRFFWCGRRC